MTLADDGLLDLAPLRLEYRMIGPRPDEAPTIVMLHEGLGSVGLWAAFPEQLASATGAGVFVYSRANYGKSSAGTLPRSVNFMNEEALGVLPRVLAAEGTGLMGPDHRSSLSPSVASASISQSVAAVAATSCWSPLLRSFIRTVPLLCSSVPMSSA